MAQTHQDPHRDFEPAAPPGRGATRQFRVVPKSEPVLFSSIEFADSRKNAVVMSAIFHCVLLGVSLAIPLFIYDQINVKRYYPVTLVPPVPRKEVLEVTHWKPIALPPPKPEPVPPPVAKLEAPPVELKRPEPPKPKPEEFKPPDVKITPKPALVAESKHEELKPPEPPKEVKTNIFSMGSSATPTVNLPPKQVQTGGFGDPNGMKGEGRPDKVTNIGALGSFDLPVGPGAGNGTGGAKGVKGVVASAGFGNGVATDTPGAGGAGRAAKAVKQGGFGDMDTPAATSTTTKKHEAEATPTAVEITFKPRPDYSEEARKLKIEGDVLVRVVFMASGQVKVLGVTRGLGHGLDENAVKAAEQIKFKPAAREGTPVDSTATVRIVFQLAY